MISRLQIFSLVWLAVLWMMVWGDFSLGMFVFGLIVGLITLVVFPMPKLATTVVVRPIPVVVLATRFLLNLATASAQVTWLAIRPRPISTGAMVRVPLRTNDELLQAVTAELVGLVPGTIVIDLDRRHGELDLHVLDLNSAEQAQTVRRDVWAQEERVRRAFEADYPGGRRG